MQQRLVAINDQGRRVGETHPRAKFTDHEVELMRKLRGAGWSFDRLAAAFECAKATVADICHGRIRSQVATGVRRVPFG